MTYLLQHFVDVDFVSLNVLLGFLALFPWSLGASFHHGLLLGLRWPSGFLQTLTLPSLLLPFYSLRWSHVPPCHAALQQQQKKKERDANRRSKPLPETLQRHQNNKQQKRRKSEDVRFTTSTLFFPSFPCSPFTRELSRPLLVPHSHLNFTVD